MQVIDEFIFSWSAPGTGGQGRQSGDRGSNKGARRKTGKLSNIQQLQLIQILADYFNSQEDFNLLCSVFMIIFMVQGKDVEYKVNSLSRLLSYALSVNAVTILNFGGVWLTQQSPTSGHSLSVARHMVADVTSIQHSHLHSLPAKSPLFTTNLIAAIGELYSHVTSEPDYSTYTAPPTSVVSLVTAWLRGGQETRSSPGSVSVPVPDTSPVVSLLPWSVFSTLLPGAGSYHETYSLLHHTLVVSISSSAKSPLPTKYLTHLTEGLVSRLASGNYSDQHVSAALDKYGQIIAAALAVDNTKLDKDLLTIMKKLPHNRLVQIVIVNNK